MQCVLHPSILSEIDESPIIMGVEEQHLNVNSIEICNTFAGIEYAFDSSLVALFPCWPAMVMAVMTCPPDFRKWAWSKLIRFDKLGHLRLEAVKKNVATLQPMPEILEEESSSETELHPDENPIIDVDDDEANIDKVNLKTDSDLTHDDLGMESLTNLRGLFWNYDE